MSKYLPLNLKWRFFTKNGRAQFKSLFYRIYINIFGIFLRIPILPMGVDFKGKTFDIYYKGDNLICYFKKGKLRYQSLVSSGQFNSLKEINEFWKRYYEDCKRWKENRFQEEQLKNK